MLIVLRQLQSLQFLKFVKGSLLRWTLTFFNVVVRRLVEGKSGRCGFDSNAGLVIGVWMFCCPADFADVTADLSRFCISDNVNSLIIGVGDLDFLPYRFR